MNTAKLGDLLVASEVWNDFVQDSDTSGSVLLRHVRAEGDLSEDLILRYRAGEADPVLVTLVFSRFDEEGANEGMYTLYCWASNCIHWIGENAGRADLVMQNRPDTDVLEVLDSEGHMLERHVGTWMFWTD